MKHDDILRFVGMVPGAGWAFDSDSDSFVLSTPLAQKLGLTPLMPLKSSEIARSLHPKKLSRLIREWTRCLSFNIEFGAVHQLRSNGRAPTRVRLSAKPLLEHDSNNWWLGTSLNVDDEPVSEPENGTVTLPRREYEEMISSQKVLWDREHQLRLVVTTLPAVVWETQLDGSVTFFNRRSGEFPHFVLPPDGDPQSAMMMAMRSVIHPDDQDKLEDAIVESMATGDGWMQRYRRRTQDGYRWLEGRTKPLRDESGRVTRWYGLAIDVDDEVRASERLRSAVEDLERITRIASMAELSASISHEVSQPLASLVLNADACRRWMLQDPPNIERARSSAEAAYRDAQISSEIVKRTRTMFQLGEENRVLTSVNTIVRDVCDIFSQDEQSKKVVITKLLDRSEPHASVDTLQIRQVLMNLLRNAFEAMVESGVARPGIQVATNSNSEEITISVEDQGGGVADLSRMFDTFYTTKPKGTGLGLAICRTVVTRHGGKISAENANDGARVWFTLKREEVIGV